MGSAMTSKPIPKTLTLTGNGNVADKDTGTEYLSKLHGYDSQDQPTIAELVRRYNAHEEMLTALSLLVYVVGHNSCTDGHTPNGFVVALDRGRAVLRALGQKDV
jgi:hypothetical protein